MALLWKTYSLQEALTYLVKDAINLQTYEESTKNISNTPEKGKEFLLV